MPSAEITVSFCNPQKPGKKNASVKTADDQLYLVPPELYPQFKEGGKYKVDYKTSTFNGSTFKFIEKVEAASPSPGARHQAGKYGVTDMATAERIFVCGAINATLSNQNLDPRGLTEEDMTKEVNKLRTVWSRTFGNPQQDADMQDSIPY